MSDDDQFAEIIGELTWDEMEAEAMKSALGRFAGTGFVPRPSHEAAIGLGVTEGIMSALRMMRRLGWLREGVNLDVDT